MNPNYLINVIQAAVKDGMELDPETTIAEAWQQAEDYLLENEPYGIWYEHHNLEGHGMAQSYTWHDEASGAVKTMTGEIFNFPKAKKEDRVYFKRTPMGEEPYEAVSWYDIPEKENWQLSDCYIAVYAKEVRSDGKVIYIYDTLYTKHTL